MLLSCHLGLDATKCRTETLELLAKVGRELHLLLGLLVS